MIASLIKFLNLFKKGSDMKNDIPPRPKECLIDFSSDPNIISFELATNLSIYDAFDAVTISKIMDLVLLTATAVNQKEVEIYKNIFRNYMQKCEVYHTEEQVIEFLFDDEVSNFKRMIENYKGVVQNNHFPFKIHSFTNSYVVLIKNNEHASEFRRI